MSPSPHLEFSFWLLSPLWMPPFWIENLLFIRHGTSSEFGKHPNLKRSFSQPSDAALQLEHRMLTYVLWSHNTSSCSAWLSGSGSWSPSTTPLMPPHLGFGIPTFLFLNLPAQFAIKTFPKSVISIFLTK